MNNTTTATKTTVEKNTRIDVVYRAHGELKVSLVKLIAGYSGYDDVASIIAIANRFKVEDVTPLYAVIPGDDLNPVNAVHVFR